MVLDMRQQGLRQNPPFNALPIRPFAAHDVCKPTHFLSGGFLDTTALKEASPIGSGSCCAFSTGSPHRSAALRISCSPRACKVSDWQTNAGNQVRTEMQQGLAAG
jgi:hypothetical protein